MIPVKNFGAVGNGVDDDFPAIKKAPDSGEREIYVPFGIYCISGTLLVHSDTASEI